MKFTVLSIFIFLMLPLKTDASSEKIVKDSITSQGKQRTYHLFVPESLSPTTPAPLIVLLHGSGRNGLSLVEKWKDKAKQEGLIIVGPDSWDSSQWVTPVDGPDFLHELVEAIKSKYLINPRKVYLFGHSGGAIFALYMSLYESQYFAATAVHAGAIQPEDYPIFDYAKRKIPMAIFVGTKDPYFPLTVVRSTRDELKKREFPGELTEIPNHNHSYYDLAATINNSVWEFLKKHELAEDPRYQQYDFKK
ncbi:MAG: alpha/beta hydrolase-fold protein [Acidobacteriota bacterium]